MEGGSCTIGTISEARDSCLGSLLTEELAFWEGEGSWGCGELEMVCVLQVHTGECSLADASSSKNLKPTSD